MYSDICYRRIYQPAVGERLIINIIDEGQIIEASVTRLNSSSNQYIDSVMILQHGQKEESIASIIRGEWRVELLNHRHEIIFDDEESLDEIQVTHKATDKNLNKTKYRSTHKEDTLYLLVSNNEFQYRYKEQKNGDLILDFDFSGPNKNKIGNYEYIVQGGEFPITKSIYDLIIHKDSEGNFYIDGSIHSRGTFIPLPSVEVKISFDGINFQSVESNL